MPLPSYKRLTSMTSGEIFLLPYKMTKEIATLIEFSEKWANLMAIKFTCMESVRKIQHFNVYFICGCWIINKIIDHKLFHSHKNFLSRARLTARDGRGGGKIIAISQYGKQIRNQSPWKGRVTSLIKV